MRSHQSLSYSDNFSIFYEILNFITAFSKSPPMVPTLSRMNPVHTTPPYFSIYLRLYSPLLDLDRFLVSWSFTQSVGLLGRGSARRKDATCTHKRAQTQKKRKQTSMPQVGFESAIPPFEREKTVHAFDSAVAVIGTLFIYNPFILLPTSRSS
jgi:hypothetical protein